MRVLKLPVQSGARFEDAVELYLYLAHAARRSGSRADHGDEAQEARVLLAALRSQRAVAPTVAPELWYIVFEFLREAASQGDEEAVARAQRLLQS